MNSDTVRTVNEIKKNGWYRTSTSMGDGGWSAVYKLGEFKTYVLDAIECQSWTEIEVIRALSDEKAFEAFSKLYHLEMFDEWEILERVTKSRLIKSKETGE